MNSFAWKPQETQFSFKFFILISYVASVSYEELTGLTAVLFSPSKFIEPTVTLQRPPDVSGNDPLVNLGNSGKRETIKEVCAILPTTYIQFLIVQNQHIQHDSPAEREHLVEIKGRVMNKILAPNSLGFGQGNSEVFIL